MDHANLNAEQKNAILAQGESHFFDVKSKRIQPAKLTRSVSAFANADGGELFIGVEDHAFKGDRWDGFENEEAANQFVATLTELYPPGEIFSYSFLTSEESAGIVLKIEILKNRNVWPDSTGDHYIRRGAQNLKLDREGVRRLEYGKGLVSFEDSKLDVGYEYIADSKHLHDFIANVVPAVDQKKWLMKQRLIVDDKLTVAGALLFSDEPQALTPKAAIKVYRYQTSDQATRETLEGQPETIEGNAYDQIHNAVNRVVEIVERIPVMRDSGFEAIVYPNNAIHEIITNSVIHRDYNSRVRTH